MRDVLQTTSEPTPAGDEGSAAGVVDAGVDVGVGGAEIGAFGFGGKGFADVAVEVDTAVEDAPAKANDESAAIPTVCGNIAALYETKKIIAMTATTVMKKAGFIQS